MTEKLAPHCPVWFAGRYERCMVKKASHHRRERGKLLRDQHMGAFEPLCRLKYLSASAPRVGFDPKAIAPRTVSTPSALIGPLGQSDRGRKARLALRQHRRACRFRQTFLGLNFAHCPHHENMDLSSIISLVTKLLPVAEDVASIYIHNPNSQHKFAAIFGEADLMASVASGVAQNFGTVAPVAATTPAPVPAPVETESEELPAAA